MREDILIAQMHGGSCRDDVRLDFSVNLNPLGLPRTVMQALREGMTGWNAYPDPECRKLVRQLAARLQLGEKQIVCGNGAAELIYLLVQAVRPGCVLVQAPSFSEYERAAAGIGCEVRQAALRQEENFTVDMRELTVQIGPDVDMVFLCNPNNPTGRAVSADEVALLAEACEKNGSLLVLDECFCELSDDPARCSMIRRLDDFPHLVILRAFTKTYAMAGLRLGYACVSDRGLAEDLKDKRQPWSVSLPAQQAAVAALADADYLDEGRAMIREGRACLSEGLARLGFTVYPSSANFLLFSDPDELWPGQLGSACLARGILLRDCRSFAGLGNGFYRIGVRAPQDNAVLLETLNAICNSRKDCGKANFSSQHAN